MQRSSERHRSAFSEVQGRILDLFESQFDRPWLAKILDDMPIEPDTIKQVRQFLHKAPTPYDDLSDLRAEVEVLRSFLSFLEHQLLPVLRERLGLSGFDPHYRLRDRDTRVLEGMVAYTFPHNLKRMKAMCRQLEVLLNEAAASGFQAPDDSPEPSAP
jgi:hypothetical protein